MAEKVNLSLSFTFADQDSKDKFETALKGWVKQYEREESIYRLLLTKEDNRELAYINFIGGW